MNKIIINGKKELSGAVDISGSKNAVLPILCAALLTDEECVISNVPDITDVQIMIKILSSFGAKIIEQKDLKQVIIRADNIKNKYIDEHLFSSMRASFLTGIGRLGRSQRANLSAV
jgi:UDP-N-acetylglucosamine 1-carboxyvinyltransferase